MTVALMPLTAERLCIGFVSESYLPRVSGVVHSVDAFVGALREQGHRVVVVAPAYRGYRDAHPDIIRFPSIRIPRNTDFPLAIPYSSSGWHRLRTMGLDLVHTHSPFQMGLVGARLARSLRIPLVFTHHTLYDEYVHYIPWIGSRLTRPAVRAYTRAYANWCDCIIAPSRPIAARLRAQGVRTRIEVLATAVVDPHLFESLQPGWVRSSYGVPPAGALVATASRLAKEKSVELVLDAFAEVKKRHAAKLLVIGGGPEEASLRQRAVRVGIAADTIFTGLLPHRQTLECLAAADVFLFASQTETQGLVIAEAMAAGLPVVAVNAGGVSDTIRDGETGFLVPPQAQRLAEKTVLLLGDSARRQAMRAQAFAAVAQFSPEILAHQLVELYRSLISRRQDSYRATDRTHRGSWRPGT